MRGTETFPLEVEGEGCVLKSTAPWVTVETIRLATMTRAPRNPRVLVIVRTEIYPISVTRAQYIPSFERNQEPQTPKCSSRRPLEQVEIIRPSRPSREPNPSQLTQATRDWYEQRCFGYCRQKCQKGVESDAQGPFRGSLAVILREYTNNRRPAAQPKKTPEDVRHPMPP